MRLKLFGIIFLFVLVVYTVASTPYDVEAERLIQEITQTIPTVTGTVSGPMVTARSDGETFVNVRSGPGLFYDKIGVLLAGQQAPALGKSSGGDWILIEYAGVEGSQAWVYSSFVNLSVGANLSIVEPPPTPTAQMTSTIDPTLAAQFVVTAAATRLPTFTDPAPLEIPTYEKNVSSGVLNNIPIGMVIVLFAALGILLMLFVFTQGR